METNNGFVKIHRSILSWEWYQNENVKSVFLHLLLRANHKPQKWQGITVDKGQLVCGRFTLAKELGISEQSIRTALTKLKSTSEITIKSTNRFSLITIVNWGAFQGVSTNKSTNNLTNNQPTTNQQLTTNKNDKNVKNDKNIYNSPETITDLDVKEIAQKLGVSVKAVEDKLDDLKDAVEVNSKKYKYDNYKAALRNWVKMGIKRGEIQVKSYNPADDDMIAKAIRSKNGQ